MNAVLNLSPALFDLLGYAAAGCTTLAFVPQVLQVWRSGSARDISTAMYAVFIVGVALWLVYGLAIGAAPIVAANGLTLLLASAVLAMKWRFRRVVADTAG